MSKIYFIKAVGEDIFKVGITRSSLEHRFNQIQTGNHLRLEIFSTIMIEKDELELAEAAIHKALIDFRLRGEWFAIGEDEIKERVENLGFRFGNDGCKMGHRNVFNAQGNIVRQHKYQDFVWLEV